MNGYKMFRRHFLVSILSIATFLAIGVTATRVLMRFNPPGGNRAGGGPVLFARIAERLGSGDPVKGLNLLREWDPSAPMGFDVLDSSGKSLVSGQKIFPDWESKKKPSAPYEAESLRSQPDPGPMGDTLVRLSGEQPTYFVMRGGPRMGPPPRGGFLGMLGVQILAILAGVAFSVFLLIRTFREKALLADSVLREMQSGNLKARFPISRLDDLGQAMSRFNRMADEIETLVERMRASEKARMTLLQELAHDLRTPIASLTNIVAVVRKKQASDDQKTREDLLDLAEKEVQYFERLVEDLLILAQISEPRYHADQKIVSLTDLLEDEAESASAQHRHDGKEIRLLEQLGEEEIRVPGDEHLLRRMLRNAIDNAFSFASGEVSLSVSVLPGGQVSIVVEDDGPGLSKEVLSSFGERRVTRMLNKAQGDRLSVGLGSVIMKTVAQIHRGALLAGNREESQGKAGARIEIRLPLAS